MVRVMRPASGEASGVPVGLGQHETRQAADVIDAHRDGPHAYRHLGRQADSRAGRRQAAAHHRLAGQNPRHRHAVDDLVELREAILGDMVGRPLLQPQIRRPHRGADIEVARGHDDLARAGWLAGRRAPAHRDLIKHGRDQQCHGRRDSQSEHKSSIHRISYRHERAGVLGGGHKSMAPCRGSSVRPLSDSARCPIPVVVGFPWSSDSAGRLTYLVV
jgi:hypothetical protein